MKRYTGMIPRRYRIIAAGFEGKLAVTDDQYLWMLRNWDEVNFTGVSPDRQKLG